jgi:hypothetical protein
MCVPGVPRRSPVVGVSAPSSLAASCGCLNLNLNLELPGVQRLGSFSRLSGRGPGPLSFRISPGPQDGLDSFGKKKASGYDKTRCASNGRARWSKVDGSRSGPTKPFAPTPIPSEKGSGCDKTRSFSRLAAKQCGSRMDPRCAGHGSASSSVTGSPFLASLPSFEQLRAFRRVRVSFSRARSAGNTVPRYRQSLGRSSVFLN